MSVTLDYLPEPISHWLDDQAVEEVCINGPGEAWVYSRGAFARHDVPALDVDWIEDIAIVAAAQRRQDISHRRPLLATDCKSVFDRLRVLIKQTPGGAAVSDADITSQLHALIDVIVHAARNGSTFMVDEVWFRRCEP